MFEQTFKNLDDVLWKEAGCSSELDYIEQASWMLFLKYLDDLEQERAMEADLTGKSHDFIIQPEFRWSTWAAPKNDDGTFDRDNGLKGDDLIEFAKNELFPYLEGFKQRASSPDTIEYKIGEIFSEIKNRKKRGKRNNSENKGDSRSKGRKKISIIEIAAINTFAVLITFLLEFVFLLKHETRKSITYEKIDLIVPDKYEEMKADMELRTGLQINRFEVGKIDFLNDTAQVKIFFYEDEQSGS